MSNEEISIKDQFLSLRTYYKDLGSTNQNVKLNYRVKNIQELYHTKMSLPFTKKITRMTTKTSCVFFSVL